MPHVPGPFSIERPAATGFWLVVAIVATLSIFSVIGLTAIAARCFS